MRTVKKADLDKMQQSGIKVRKKIGSKAARKEPTPVKQAPAPEKSEPVVNVDTSTLAASIEKATSVMVRTAEANNKAILALQAKLIASKEAAPRSYKFTVHRDSYGYIETVDAVPGKS